MIFGATSYKDTKFGIIPRSKLIKLEQEGVVKGLHFVQKLAKSKKGVYLTPELIKNIHEKSFGWIFPDWVGKFRTIDVTYSGKEAPPYYKINELIINLCLDTNEQIQNLSIKTEPNFLEQIIKLLARFQHQLVFIHPFNDYNGRTARLLTTLLLLQFRIPSIEIKASNIADRKKYIKAMQYADNGDYINLEKLIENAINEALEKFDKAKIDPI